MPTRFMTSLALLSLACGDGVYKSEFDTGSAPSTDGASTGAEGGPSDIDADSPDTDGGGTNGDGGTTEGGEDSSSTDGVMILPGDMI